MDFSAAQNSASLTTEQKEYLLGFFAGATQQHRPFLGIGPDGRFTSHGSPGVANLAEPVVHGMPLSELSREELWKYEEHPLDLWDKLIAHAEENRAPIAGDVFRFKFHGLFYVAPAQDSFMLRLRVPGGVLKSYQLRGLAGIAEELGSGRADITTRANLQIRELHPRDIVGVLNRVQALGLTSRGAGADNIRNITASPITGLDPTELLDVAPLAEALHHYILNSRDLYDLPRKFNIAFDNGGAISVVVDTNDIGFVAVRIGEGREVQSGVYFRVLLGGITGHKQFAADCGVLLRPEQSLAFAAAILRVYAVNGDRTDRKKARLKYLVDRWGIERFIGEVEKRLAFAVLHSPAELCDSHRPIDRAAHIGVHRQRQNDFNYIGVAVTVGRLPAAQMRTVADISEQYGSGEIRLTVWQNLLIPNVPSIHIPSALQALRDAGLDHEAGAVSSGTVACTGNRGCRYAATDTKAHAVELANNLDSKFKIDQPINLHVTGCPHSCAQHYIGDIGLMGMKVDGEEGYQVVIGGGSDRNQGLGRELIPSIRYNDLQPVLERLFAAYVAGRKEGETLLDFSRRHSIQDLKKFIAVEELAS